MLCGLPSIPRIAPGVALSCSSCSIKSWDAIPRMEFCIPRMEFQFRELLREYPGTLRELREWPFHSESVFPQNWGGPQASDYSAIGGGGVHG